VHTLPSDLRSVELGHYLHAGMGMTRRSFARSRMTVILRRRGAGTSLMVAAALVIGAEASVAQYPLAPSPVLDPRLFTSDLTIGGYLSVRETIRRDSSTFAVNRARVTLQIAPRDFVIVRVQSDLAALGRTSGDTVPGFVLTDAYLQLSPPNGSRPLGPVHPRLILGQFRTPFSLEYLTPFSLLQTANRSQVVDRIATRRDIGVMGHLAFQDRVTLAGGLVNGEGPNSIRNANGKQLIVARLTLLPLPMVAIGGKWAGEGPDHRWGYDVRWMTNGLVLEGERVERRAPLNGGMTQRASGHYLMASYRVGRYLQPVVKWEQLNDARTLAGVESRARLTWTTYAVNVTSTPEVVRLQTNWIVKRERPAISANELLVQLIVIF
jgi:hypothetical protein